MSIVSPFIGDFLTPVGQPLVLSPLVNGLHAEFDRQQFRINGGGVLFDTAFDFSRPSSKWVFGGGAQTGLLVEVPAGEEAIQHDPITGEALGVLLEGSATNYAEDSDLTSSYWIKTNVSVQAVPDEKFGVVYELTDDSADGAHSITRNDMPIDVSGDLYVRSFYVKTPDIDKLRYCYLLKDSAYTSNVNGVTFDFLTGEWLDVDLFTLGTPLSPEYVGDGWYRLAFNMNSDNFRRTLGVGLSIAPRYTGSNYAGDGTAKLLVAIPQYEKGETTTSPIITQGSQVTRAADLLNSEPLNFNEWYNPSGGVLKITAQASDVGVTIATLGSLSIVSDSTEMKEYTLVYGSDPSATELDLTPVGGSVIIQKVTYV